MKILGVIIDQACSFEPHFEDMLNALKLRTNVLKRLSGTNWGLEHHLLQATYKSLITSKIAYGLPAFGQFLDPNKFYMLDTKVIHVAARIISRITKISRNDKIVDSAK